MYVIALTGGIASGKTTLLNALQKHGAPVIDADQISRSLTAKGGEALPLIRKAFGGDVFHKDGTLDRKALGDLVFSSEPDRRCLEAIIHPMVAQRINSELSGLSPEHRAAVVDVPLLYESGMESMADEVWCAYVPRREQIKRLRLRDGLTEKQALLRISSQMDLREKCRRADHVIKTTGTPAQSAAQAIRLWQEAINKLGGTRFD